MKNVKIAVIGGDKRLLYCAEALGERGLECALLGFDKISDRALSTRCTSLADVLLSASAVILPLPLSKDGKNVNSSGEKKISLPDVLEKTPPEVPIFAGLVDENTKKLAESSGHIIYDYYESEELVLKNANATAEGAIYLAMQNSEITLRGAKCLVTGYGRIAKNLCRLLLAFGAKVSVSARRKEARTKAKIEGCSVFSTEELQKDIQTYDFIFNTVPHNIFTEDVAEEMSGSQIFIELAGAPYGAAPSVLSKNNIEIVNGSALPTRYCPVSAGEFIADEVYTQLLSMGICQGRE